MLNSPNVNFKNVSGKNIVDYAFTLYSLPILPPDQNIIAEISNYTLNIFRTVERALAFIKDIYYFRALKENQFYQQYAVDLPYSITIYAYSRKTKSTNSST